MSDWRDFLTVNDYLTTIGLTKRVYFSNGKYLGDLVNDVDGYWKFWFGPGTDGGAWAGYELEAIAAMLKDLNAEWDAEMKAFLEGVDDE